MRKTLAILALTLALAASAGLAEDTPPRSDSLSEGSPSVRLPGGPPVPAIPPPLPSAHRLDPDRLFVIDADVDCLVLVSPAGAVTSAKEPGPLRVRGKFVDGPDKTETRNFKGKFVWTLEAAATGRCEVLVVPAGAKADADVIRRTLDVYSARPPPVDPPAPPPPGPVDPPKPPPVDPPAPPAPPAPIAADGLHVLVVYESGELARMPAAQHSVLYAKAVRDYLNAKCPKGPDGRTPQWRIWDKDVDASAESALWRAAFSRPRTSVPWIVVSNGKAGYEGPLPKDVADTLALLRKYGDK